MEYTRAINQIKELCDINNIQFNYGFDYDFMSKCNITVTNDGKLIDFKNMVSLLKPNERIIFSLDESNSIYWDNGFCKFIRFNSDMGSLQTPGLFERLRIMRFLNEI